MRRRFTAHRQEMQEAHRDKPQRACTHTVGAPSRLLKPSVWLILPQKLDLQFPNRKADHYTGFSATPMRDFVRSLDLEHKQSRGGKMLQVACGLPTAGAGLAIGHGKRLSLLVCTHDAEVQWKSVCHPYLLWISKPPRRWNRLARIIFLPKTTLESSPEDSCSGLSRY